MKWSAYSERIFDTYLAHQENILVQAVPGAGKTTNIRHMWSLDDRSTLYLVFNKHVQQEAEGKLPAKQGSAILTLNSLGHRIVMNQFGRVKLDDKKVMNIAKECIKYPWHLKPAVKRERLYSVVRAVQTAKCYDTDTITQDQLDQMIIQYDLESYDDILKDINTVLDISDSITHTIDFGDQLRFPVIYNCRFPEYHTILGDEVQDFNPIQAAMLKLLNAQRYVLVGDRRQSMYAFRGAMSDGMDVLKEQFHCVELPLSITYRCAKNIVAEAQKVYKEIEHWNESQDGIVRYSDDVLKEHYTDQDIVLCRMNKPLVTLAYQLLQQNIPCFVRGRDIGQGLIKLIQRQEASSVHELINALQSEHAVEYAKASLKEDEALIQRLEDKYESALVFCTQCSLTDTPDVVIGKIMKVFESSRGVCLSTVHKAKGLEAERALLLNTPLYDTFTARATQEYQAVQERNIKYVAVTRAMRELVYM